jgi:ATP-dependent DNA helicase RecQ
MMRAYAETDGCRRRLLLEYFGEPLGDGPCGACDNDLAGEPEDEPPDDLPPWLAPGREVDHPEFGRGVVRGADGGELLVAFDDHGLRTLSLDLVAAGGLLAPAPGSR